MRMDAYLDVLVPRGGHDLIQRTKREATLPVIETGEGNCHIYVDAAADFAMAEKIIVNAKCQRPSVCNAAESLLVHQAIAAEFLPHLGCILQECGVELRADEAASRHLPNAAAATEEDWSTEYQALILSVKLVDNLEEAVAHINHYGTNHSEYPNGT